MEPVSTAVAGKATEAVGGELLKTTGNLLSRVLGPSADEYGSFLQRRTHRRLANLERVALAAERKGAATAAGEVNARVAGKILDEGSQVDGELAAEYFGGMLAASKTLDGRDDAAVSWVTTVSSMSSMQIRLHFLLYREWAQALEGRADLALGYDTVRNSVKLVVEFNELVEVLGGGWRAISHAVTGLHRFGLIELYGWGGKSGAPLLGDSPYAISAAFTPSMSGCELYCWASGVQLSMANVFTTTAVAFDTEPPTPFLSTTVLPELPDEPA